MLCLCLALNVNRMAAAVGCEGVLGKVAAPVVCVEPLGGDLVVTCVSKATRGYKEAL